MRQYLHARWTIKRHKEKVCNFFFEPGMCFFYSPQKMEERREAEYPGRLERKRGLQETETRATRWLSSPVSRGAWHGGVPKVVVRAAYYIIFFSFSFEAPPDLVMLHAPSRSRQSRTHTAQCSPPGPHLSHLSARLPSCSFALA